MATTDAEPAAAAAAAGPAPRPVGRVLFAGATCAEPAGRDAAKKGVASAVATLPNLPAVHVLGGGLEKVDVVSVSAGSAASHAAAVTADGALWTWGLGKDGQLGRGDLATRNVPGPVAAAAGLAGRKVSAVACGARHTLVLLDSGALLSCGSNKYGQLGTGSLKPESSAVLVAVAAPAEAVAVACGADFSAAAMRDGTLWTWGLPQHGVLGHGTDNEYNSADGSVKLVYAPQATPRAVESLRAAGVRIRQIAAGHTHCVAIDTKGGAWTWGSGDYGKLGHREQKAEFKPRQVSIPGGERNACPPDAVCAAGATSSFVSCAQGQTYFWGKLKVNSSNQMYPTAFMELSGWFLASFGASNTFATCSTTDPGAVTWGAASFGELGYGGAAGAPKTSANPKRVDALASVRVLGVAVGTGNTFFLADAAADLSPFPVWQPPEDAAGPAGAAAGDDDEGGAGGDEPPAKGKGKGKAAAKRPAAAAAAPPAGGAGARGKRKA